MSGQQLEVVGMVNGKQCVSESVATPMIVRARGELGRQKEKGGTINGGTEELKCERGGINRGYEGTHFLDTWVTKETGKLE